MLNSKALKPNKKFKFEYENDYDDGKMNLFQKLNYFLKKYLIWTITDNYKQYSRKIKRSWAFAKFSWSSYDWDFHYVYSLMAFKCRRVYKALENGSAVQEKEDMDALIKMIKVLNRLSNGHHDQKYHRQHRRKWGELQSKTIPSKYNDKGEPVLYQWISWRDSTKDASQELKDQERKEFMECYEKGEQDRCKDIDLLCQLMKKHAERLWD